MILIDTFIKEYSKAINIGKASLFIGSGLSRDAKYAGWKDILRECAEDIGLNVDKEEQNLITLAEYYVRGNQRTKINEALKDFFSDTKGDPTENHRIIATFPISSIWTTNYDTLIERSYKAANITYTVLTDDNSYKEAGNGIKITIHKIHGDVITTDKCVITRKDYEEFEETHDIVLSELKGEMCSNSFLFLGYSFSDTDIQHILSRIRLIYKNSHPQRHYCIVEKIDDKKCKDNEDYKYQCKKQEHHISDMQSYGLNVVLVDSYNEITSILERIRKRVLLKNVLICGAYEDKYSYAKRSADCAKKIALELILQDYKIFTGYGNNLGSDIVAGAFDGCRKAKKHIKDFNNNVFLFPFPFKQRNDDAREQLYYQLRLNMVSKTQITIVISGNNKSGNSEGVIREVEIAEKQGSLIIPIATTGGAALVIWDRINKTGSAYAKSTGFQNLCNIVDPDEIYTTVKNIIDDYTNSLK